MTFKPDATETEIDNWRGAVRQMCETNAEVRAFTLGDNLGTGPNHFDAALVADFPDLAAFRRSIDGPLHAAYVRDHPRQVVGKIAAIQHDI